MHHATNRVSVCYKLRLQEKYICLSDNSISVLPRTRVTWPWRRQFNYPPFMFDYTGLHSLDNFRDFGCPLPLPYKLSIHYNPTESSPYTLEPSTEGNTFFRNIGKCLTTRRHDPEVHHLKNRRCENIETCINPKRFISSINPFKLLKYQLWYKPKVKSITQKKHLKSLVKFEIQVCSGINCSRFYLHFGKIYESVT